MMTKRAIYLVVGAILFGLLAAAYKAGQHSEKKVTWFSELSMRTQGRKAYIIDTEIICSNGKDVGRLQVDLNLTNGKLYIVRNDSKLEPDCAK